MTDFSIRHREIRNPTNVCLPQEFNSAQALRQKKKTFRANPAEMNKLRKIHDRVMIIGLQESLRLARTYVGCEVSAKW